MVGNGDHLSCIGYCSKVPLTLPTNTLAIPFYLLPIQGAYVVLGVQWLQTLGPFVSDYTVPSMQFKHNGNLITLHGSNSSLPTPATFHQFTRQLHNNAIATCHSITLLQQQTSHIPTDPTTVTKEIPNFSQLPPNLATVLHQYLHVFYTPTALPPNRANDHHIHLSPNYNPINIKP